MKKQLLLLLIFTFSLFSLPVAAQHKGNPDKKMMKEITEYKIKFIAQEIGLKDDQKEKFIDLYKKLNEERMKNFRRIRHLEKTLNEDSSEKDYKEASQTISDLKLQDAQLEKDYDTQFAKFLSQKQIYKMKEAEDQFRRKMNEMRQKKCAEKKKK